MSDRNATLYLADILDSAAAIHQFLDGMTFDDFVEDRRTYSATIREFIVIGEAVGKLIDTLQQRFPEYQWRMIKDFRSFIVHEYFGVDARIVWDAAQKELGELESLVLRLKNETS